MKKLFFISITFLAIQLSFTTKSFAQYSKGDKLLNAGIGLGTYGYGGLGLGGSLEFGISDDISVGPLVGYSGTDSFGYRFSVLTVGGRGSYHLNNLLQLKNDKLDIYAGVGLGYRNISWGYTGLGGASYGSGIVFLGHAGGRYYVSKNLGFFAELGSGFGSLTAGVAFKL